MKKYLSLLLITSIILIGLTGCKDKKKEDNNLFEYIKSHSGIEYTGDYPMFLMSESFKCNDMNKGTVTYLNDNVLVLNGNTFYQVTYDSIFSNNQNCKKLDTDIDVKEVKKNKIITNDDKVYSYYMGDEGLVLDEISGWSSSNTDANIIKDEDTKFLVANSYDNKEHLNIYYVLKTDNNIHVYKYDNSYKLVDEDIIETSNYGNISYVDINSNAYEPITGKEIELDGMAITRIISDKGIYSIKEIETKECKKYADVKCETKLVESELVKKYKKDIKHLDYRQSILNDGSVISTEQLIRDIEK